MKREKQVISPELRLEMAEQVASGKMNCAEAARAYGSHQTSVRYWTALYKEHGPAIFADIGINNLYSPEFKMKAVQACTLAGFAAKKVSWYRHISSISTRLQFLTA